MTAHGNMDGDLLRILQEHDLFPDLYEIFNVDNLSMDDLRSMMKTDNGVAEYCKESGMNQRQRGYVGVFFTFFLSQYIIH